MDKQHLDTLFKKYSEGKCSRKERELVEKFLDSAAAQNKSVIPISSTKEQLLFKNIKEATTTKANNTKHNTNKARFAVKIAAALIILIGAGTIINLLFTNNYTTVITANTQRKTIQLEDGSEIILNSGSSLAYHNNFSTHRKIKLSGEAFFKVAKDPEHPFQIVTDSVTTTVLGTSFNIHAYEGFPIKVSVRTGKVMVQTPETFNSPNFLLPNQSIAFQNIGETKVNLAENFTDTAGWLNNTIIFNQTSLDEVAVTLEKWYNVKITFENPQISKLKINAKFKDEALETVLESITYLENLTYEYLNEHTIIIKE